MKKLFILAAFVLISIMTFAQRGTVITLTADTLKGVDTTSYVIELRGPGYDLEIDAVFTQVGGTSDGTATVYGSLDGTNYVLINGVGAGVITASPVASITGADLNQLTITNGLVGGWSIKNLPWTFIKWDAIGTALDTTEIAAKYRYQ
jgi:hypothetical protein